MNEKEVLIYVTVFALILSIYTFIKIKTGLDKVMIMTGIIAQIISIYGCITNDINVLFISHLTVVTVLVGLAFFGKSKLVLQLNSLMLSIVLLSRFHFGRCIFAYKGIVGLGDISDSGMNIIFGLLLIITYLKYKGAKVNEFF